VAVCALDDYKKKPEIVSPILLHVMTPREASSYGYDSGSKKANGQGHVVEKWLGRG